MVKIENINVLAELERIGIHYESAGGDEVKVICPFHEDNSPSCHVNTQKRLFKCQSSNCEETGTIIDLLARFLKTPAFNVVDDLAKRYELSDEKVIDPQTVERWHQAIWKADALRNELYRRGLNDDLIRYYRLGEVEGRISIPVPSATGNWVNVRKYLPGAPGKDKMRNTRGHGSIRWFPVDQLQYDTIVVTGGECKAIVGAYWLNQHGIGCITATCGEDNLPVELLKQLAGKRVYVLLDIDKAGRTAAKKHCEQIRVVANYCADILLPLDADKYPKGDINDYVMQPEFDLLALVNGATEYIADHADKLVVDETPPILMELNDAIDARNADKRISVKGVISAMDTTPYLVPKDIRIECGKDQDICGICPIFLHGKSEFTIPAESPAILEFIGTNSQSHLEVIKKAIGIPYNCRSCNSISDTLYNVEDTRVSPQLEITSKSGDRQPIPAYCIGNGLSLNERYDLTGKLLAHPKNQQATFLISEHKTSQDALVNFQLKEPEQLGHFWPREMSIEGIQEKLDNIYADFEANITRIYKRRDMHLMVDLTYHSPLFFEFDGKLIKGWVDTLIMGDSGHGKSEVTFGMQKHYGLGANMTCDNCSVAGILGGLEQMNGRWFISWGVIPLNDRRIVIMDEIKKAPVEVIARLTAMRSSGIAQVSKIGKQWQTHARTRQIWLSNPRSDAKMAQQTFGIKAVLELIGSPEDVRRFDAVLLVADSEISFEEINQLHEARPEVPHFYGSDLCRQLVLWAWTRGEGQVQFTAEATRRALTAASELCEQFSDIIPIISRGDMRYKLARLAAALAARLFSCSEDYESIVVEECHVEYIKQTLQRIYSSHVFGYTEFTATQRLATTLIDPDLIRKQIEITPFPKDFCKSLLARDFIESGDLADWTSWDKTEVQSLLSLLVRKHALIRSNKAYRKSALFIEFLKKLIDEDNWNEPPPHIEKERF